MNVKRLMMLISLCSCLSVGAQTVQISGKYADSALDKMVFLMRAMGTSSSAGMDTLYNKDQSFKGNVAVASDGFYTLVGIGGGRQMLMPLYLPDANRKYMLDLKVLSNGCPVVDLDADNSALSAFNEVNYKKGREFWEKGRDMKPEQFLPFLKGYMHAADSISKHYRCSQPVAGYLTLWAYTLAFNAYESITHITGIHSKDLPFTRADFMGEPSQLFDTPMATYFPSATSMISQSLPDGTLSEQLAYLHSRYKTEALCKAVQKNLVNKFITTFDFKTGFDAGVAELEAATQTYGLDKSYLEDFKKRRASVEGTAFPEGIILTDAQGNRVDFSRFKGSYVYVDLWASWCGPCCKEVPHLQKLEKELGNEKVVFVSISLDKNKAAWQAKMKALDMHGYQLLNQDNKLAEALNVKGIPFFLIYDKEGKLHQYNAPRPSDPALKDLLEKLP